MRRTAGALGAALALSVLSAGHVSAQAECVVSLDASVLVAPGEQRDCAIWVVGHHATVARDGVVGGGVTVAFGNAAIDGEVTGSVNVLGGDAAVTGQVRGDVYASGRVRLSASARVRGNVTGGHVAAADGAVVDGTTIELQRGWAGLPRSGRQWIMMGARILMRSLVTLILAGLFGGLAALSFPGFVGRLRDIARRPTHGIAAATALGLVCLAVTGAVVWTFWRQPASRLITVVPASLALTGALGVGSRLGGWLLPRRQPAPQTGAGLALVALALTFVLQLGHWVFFCTGGLLFVLVGAWSIGIAMLAPFLPPSGPITDPRRPSHAAPGHEDEHAALAARADDPPPAPVDPLPVRAERSAALDVRRIPGISPIYAHLLTAAGIPTLTELADVDPAELVTSLSVPGVLPVDLATAELWVAMARRRVGR